MRASQRRKCYLCPHNNLLASQGTTSLQRDDANPLTMHRLPIHRCPCTTHITRAWHSPASAGSSPCHPLPLPALHRHSTQQNESGIHSLPPHPRRIQTSPRGDLATIPSSSSCVQSSVGIFPPLSGRAALHGPCGKHLPTSRSTLGGLFALAPFPDTMRPLVTLELGLLPSRRVAHYPSHV